MEVRAGWYYADGSLGASADLQRGDSAMSVITLE
jgi:hypothetical protein